MKEAYMNTIQQLVTIPADHIDKENIINTTKGYPNDKLGR